jgi:hypothetical protein
MTIANVIQDKVRLLPEPTQKEVLDFVGYLLQRSRQEDMLWSELSAAIPVMGEKSGCSRDFVGLRQSAIACILPRKAPCAIAKSRLQNGTSSRIMCLSLSRAGWHPASEADCVQPRDRVSRATGGCTLPPPYTTECKHIIRYYVQNGNC